MKAALFLICYFTPFQTPSPHPQQLSDGQVLGADALALAAAEASEAREPGPVWTSS